MPPFEPTISHFIFKLEQSVLMCCTCVCPGQRMTQIKGLWRGVGEPPLRGLYNVLASSSIGHH
jgi:hypothetical protein